MANEIATSTATATPLSTALGGDVGAEQPVMTLASLRGQPIFRQMALMVVMALSVAIGVSVALWAEGPTYKVLGEVGQKDATQVIDILTKAQIEHTVDAMTGQISVASDEEARARRLLAAEGLPKKSGLSGYELLDSPIEFGTTRFAEKSRHRRALEGELARTIMSFRDIDDARVHLAFPRQSVFIRKRKQPSAAISVKLYPGRSLEKGTVQAIVHIVSSAVPNLEPGMVTVVDGKGRLLKGLGDDSELSVSTKQLDYQKKVERGYADRIEKLLASYVGPEGVRAEVSAQLDFSSTENTRESYEPDNPAIRSQQTFEENNTNRFAAGIPGALSNQPPAPPEAPEEAVGANAAAGNSAANTSRRSTINYLPDHNVVHTKRSVGDVQRLSVAIVVDHKKALVDGKIINTARTQEDLTRITEIAKSAVGFNVTRGDTISVINEAFFVPPPFAALPEPAMWEQPWFADVIKRVLAGILLLYMVFSLMQIMKKLIVPVKTKEMVAYEEARDAELAASEKGGAEGGAGGAGGAEGGEEIDEAFKLEAPKTFEMQIKAAREIVKEDPKRVAQVIKKWAGSTEDAG